MAAFLVRHDFHGRYVKGFGNLYRLVGHDLSMHRQVAAKIELSDPATPEIVRPGHSPAALMDEA